VNKHTVGNAFCGRGRNGVDYVDFRTPWAYFEMEDCFWEKTEGPEDLLIMPAGPSRAPDCPPQGSP